MIKTVFILFSVVLLCERKLNSVINVGMEIDKAKSVILNSGGKETHLQFRPEKSITGDNLKQVTFELEEKYYIIINYKAPENVVSYITLCGSNGQKKNGTKRKVIDVSNIDVNDISSELQSE